MTTNINTNDAQKKGMIPERHLHLVPIPRSPEQWLDLELAEEFSALPVPKGVERPRRFYKIAEGELFPGRVMARIVDDAINAFVHPMALLQAIIRPFKRLIERKVQKKLPPTPERRYLPGA